MTVLTALIVGCGVKKVDSGDEKLNLSIEGAKSSLSDEKNREFEEAVKAFTLSEIGNILEAAADPDRLQRRISDKLHGKTADEIILEGNRIIAEQKWKVRNQAEENQAKIAESERMKRDQALSEIEELKSMIVEREQKRSDAEKAKENLKQFNVVRSRFYYQERSFRDEAVIEITVKNDSEHAVSRAYFQGTLSSSGRSVPWVQDSFNYRISGGLEPGEEATWKLSPNMFGAWSKAPRDRQDMILTVTVTRIDGADEQPIYDSEFSEWDKDNLEMLNERLVELQKTVQSE